jgi:sugar lactone lactonase YvrE
VNEFRCVFETKALVGESPRWNPVDQTLWWVDIYAPSLNRFDPKTGQNRKYRMPERLACFSFTRRGRLIAGMESGIAFIDVEPAVKLTQVYDLNPGQRGYRFNDGRCDFDGRFWAGSVLEGLAGGPVGALYRYDPDGSCRKMVDALICPNGLAFSPDGRTLYHSDSRQDYVWAWDLDRATGNIANRRVFQHMDIQEGRPDGAACDAEGGYWICHVGAWRVARYLPDGRIDRVIGLPIQRPTACAFGGPNLETLYVTTATHPLPETMLAKQPLAGSLFAIDNLGVKGIPEPVFAD